MPEGAYPIRPLAAEELDAALSVFDEAFGEELGAGHRERVRRLYELNRSLAAFDGDDIVGTAGAYSLRMAVPGGIHPVAGVTDVAVSPTYRRRGVLRSLMTRQLTGLHEEGEPVAALIASESAIYGRFGYGCASWAATVRIRRGEGDFRDNAPGKGPASADVRLRRGDPDGYRDAMAEVHGRHYPTRPGEWARGADWWDKRLADDDRARAGGGPLRCVVAYRGNIPAAYALFQVRPEWGEFSLPAHELRVREVVGTEPAGYAAVWRHLLDSDLVGTVTSSNQPVDDPLFSLLADPRRARVTVTDGLWVRLVDVGAALARRGYARPIDVVIEVDDPGCPWNAGRWRLAGDEHGATCERTTAGPDVALGAGELGAAYLGDADFAGPAGAGLVRETRTGALRALQAAMGWHPRPHASLGF